LIIILAFFYQFGAVHKLRGQACPACSNPALQSSERLEAGMDTLHAGSFRSTFNITNGFNYQGGHSNDHGLTPDGQVISVPDHEHVVKLDFVRTEVSLEYTFNTNWSTWLRIPYDVKMQGASIIFPNPVTEEVSTYRREFEYEVGERSVSVSPTKMNVFYIGVDNPVEISAAGVAATDSVCVFASAATDAAKAKMLPSSVTTKSLSSAANIRCGVPWISARQATFGS